MGFKIALTLGDEHGDLLTKLGDFGFKLDDALSLGVLGHLRALRLGGVGLTGSSGDNQPWAWRGS
jgi:hypothetical protein